MGAFLALVLLGVLGAGKAALLWHAVRRMWFPTPRELAEDRERQEAAERARREAIAATTPAASPPVGDDRIMKRSEGIERPGERN
ncbi:MAG: hypothetical protein K2W96_28230 [Gemmataceae bacterium]|nr:hypothetical protein [Gemmataceae bacterium]